MSEVFPGTDLKCEEITMAVHRMQNLQLLPNTGQKCCKYKAGYIRTHTIAYPVDPGVDLFPWIPEDLLLLTRICYPLFCSIGLISFWKTLTDGKVLYVFNRDALYTRLLFSCRMRCFSVIHAIGAFTWNAATRRFQECQKVRCLHGLASPVASRLSFLKPFLHRWPCGAVTQQTVRQQWLIRSFACISNDFSVPGEICYLWITVLTLQRRL